MNIICFHKLLLSAVLVLAIFSFGDLEIQSAEMPLSEFSCSKLANLNLSAMDDKEHTDASQCDLAEADYAWEQLYGKMNDSELSVATVYE